MTRHDRKKLQKAGFTILRVREETLTIVKMNADTNWELSGKYPTKAALWREVARIDNQEPLTIIE